MSLANPPILSFIADLVHRVSRIRHLEYRDALLEHLMTVTLRHWDPAMRQLGAQSLRGICQLSLDSLGLSSAERVVDKDTLYSHDRY